MNLFQTYVIDVLRHHYSDFKGRVRRREFWMFALFTSVVSLLLALPSLVMDPTSPALAVFNLLSFIVNLGLLIPTLALGARRLHDTGRSGWWQLLFLIPLIGWAAALALLALDSVPAANRWGAHPKTLLTRA